MKTYDRIACVYGTSGPIGRAYVDRMALDKRTLCYGFTRNSGLFSDSDNCSFPSIGIDTVRGLDFLGDKQKLPLDPCSKIREIIMVYTIGPSSFEPPEAVKINPSRGPFARNIDEDIYQLNLQGFRDLTKLIFDIAKSKAMKEPPIHLKLVGLASICDKYDPAFWQSYTKSKKILRRYIRMLTLKHRDDPDVSISGIVVNVSTIDTPNERKTRPGVTQEERARWLTPRQVVNGSMPLILDAKPGTYTETDIYNPWPGFTPDIYKDLPASRARWNRQLTQP